MHTLSSSAYSPLRMESLGVIKCWLQCIDECDEIGHAISIVGHPLECKQATERV